MTEGTMWVRTERDLEGRYRAVVECDEDFAFSLDDSDVHPYSRAVIEASVRARYDAAVARQLKALEIDDETVAYVINDLRDTRDPILDIPGLNVRPEPVVNQNLEALVQLVSGDRVVLQMEVGEARKHAVYCLEIVRTAPIDDQYAELLKTKVGLNEAVASNVVSGLARYREVD